MLTLLVTIAVLAVLLWQLDLDELRVALVGADRGLVAAAAGASVFGCFVLESLRWRWLLQRLGCDLPVSEAVRLQAVSMPLRLATPAKSGLVLCALYLDRHHGLPLARGLSSVLLEKLHNLVFYLLLIVTLPLSHATGQALARLPFPRSWAVLGSAVVLAAVLALGVLARVLSEGVALPLPARLRALLRDLFASLAWLSLAQQAWFLLITTGVMALTFFEFQLLFLSMGISLPLPVMAYAMTLIVLISNLPITLGGLGTREAAAVLLLAPLASQERVVAVMALLYVFHMLLPALIGVGWLPLFLRRMGGWSAVRRMVRLDEVPLGPR